MQADTLIKLIEELIEIKIRQHASTTAGTTPGLTPELARVIALTKVADRERIIQVRSELIQFLESGTDGTAA